MSSGSSEKLVARFLRQEQTSKNIVKYVLRHASKGRTGNEVESFEITEALSVDELDNLAAVIVSRAQLDADGVGPAIQRYVLVSLLEDDKPSGRQPFRLKGNSDMDIDGDDEAGEESPNQRGLLQQLMRHNEANSRTIVQSTAAIQMSMSRQMERQERLIEKLMEDRMKSFEVIEEAMSRKHERDLEVMKENAKEQRIAFGLNKIMGLLPVALSALSKGKIPMDAEKHPTLLMIKELVSGLESEQIDHLQRSLKPEQKILFFKVMQTISESQKALPNGTPDSGVEKEN